MVNFGEFLKSKSVFRQVNFNWTKIGGIAKIEKLNETFFGEFQKKRALHSYFFQTLFWTGNVLQTLFPLEDSCGLLF